MTSEEPKPEMTREVVLEARLPEIRPTERVQARRIHIPRGMTAGLHVHNGPVVGNIVSGRITYQIEGEPAAVLAPGDTFYEPEGARIARFDPIDDDATFLAYFLLGPGQEPAIEMLDQ